MFFGEGEKVVSKQISGGGRSSNGRPVLKLEFQCSGIYGAEGAEITRDSVGWCDVIAVAVSKIECRK